MPETPMVCIEESCRLFGARQSSDSGQCISCGGPTFDYEKVYEPLEDTPDDDTLQQEFLFHRTGSSTSGKSKKKERGGKKSPDYSPNPLALAPTTQSTHRYSDEFSCPPDLTDCPVAAPPSVTVPYEMFQKWISMAKALSTEWIAFLKGHESSPGQYIIEDMYIPPQYATGSFCEAEDGHIQPGTIGAVHSHVGMNVFFSSTDVEHMNHNIELVVNNKGEIIANGRTKLDCGRFHRMTAKVFLAGAPTNQALLEELKSKISTTNKKSQVWNQAEQRPKQGPKENPGSPSYGYPYGPTGNGYFRGI